MIPEDVIEKIKNENDIVEVVSEKVKLKRTGRNYVGLCPFHNEKSPSFSVSSDKQIYKCFGCGEAGNVITFIMKTRNLPFIDAVKILADKINLNLDEYSDGKVNNSKDKLYKLNVDAARFFFNNLNKNEEAKGYFNARGITDKTIRNFGLGFALNEWNGLSNFLKKKGYSELELLKLGLIIKNEKGNFYDRFRNRVIFPVFDYKGKVIGFGGRVLNDAKPKYLNSPETDLFHKGEHLYGLNFALKNNINRTLIIVEGYMDCITLHQYGINNVVASLGTALTVNQAKLLKRFADNIIISYDADMAGQNATERGLKILVDVGLLVKVLKVPEGKDPDEYIRKNGKSSFEELVANALPLIEYKINKAKEGINLKNKDEQLKYIKSVSDILVDSDSVEKNIYIKKVSEETGLSEQSIYDYINDELKKIAPAYEEVNNIDNIGQKLYLDPAFLKAERLLLKFMFEEKELYEYIVSRIDEEQFNLPSHTKIFKLIAENNELDLESKKKVLDLKCDDVESSSEWISICEEEFVNNNCDIKVLINDYITNIKKFKLEETKKYIMKNIKLYEQKGMFEESLKMVKRLNEIQMEISNLN